MSNETAATPPAPGFWEELTTTWHRLPNKGFFFVLLVMWLALFQFLGNSTFGYYDSSSLFAWLNMAYEGTNNNADDSHGPFIPIIVLVLFWWKREKLLAQPLRLWSPALLIMVAALVLHLTGYLVQQTRISVIGMFLGIYGLMGLTWGPTWLRNCFFPFFLLAFAIPLGSATDFITFPLRLMVTKLVALIGQHVLGFDVISDGTRLFKMPQQYEYEVAAACSGIRSLVAIAAIAIIYAFTVFESWWKRLVLMGSVIPLAVIGNTFRLLVIVIAAEWRGQEAGHAVHNNWFWSLLPYVPAILGLIFIGQWLERMDARKKAAANP